MARRDKPKPWAPKILRDSLMPAQLVWIGAELHNDICQEEISAVRDVLKSIVATAEFQDAFYLSDVCEVILEACRRGLSGLSAAVALPRLEFGSSPDVETARTALQNVADNRISLRTSQPQDGDECDVLSFVVYTIRIDHIETRFKLSSFGPQALEFGSSENERAAEESLVHVLRAFAAQCQFKQTGDAYLHSVVQLRLPAWPFSGQTKGTSPFKVASRLLGEKTNDLIRPLIDSGVEPFLTELEKGGEYSDHRTRAEVFAVVSCLIDEMCGEKSLLVNDHMSKSPPSAGNPRPFVTGDLGCLCPYAFGVVDGPKIWLAERPLQAAAAVLARSDPTTLQAKLWQVVSAPRGVDLPGNPFSKYAKAP